MQMANYWCEDLHLDVFGSPGNAITVYLCYFFIKQMLIPPFVATGYYKISKKEAKVISLTDSKLKCFSTRI